MKKDMKTNYFKYEKKRQKMKHTLSGMGINCDFYPSKWFYFAAVWTVMFLSAGPAFSQFVVQPLQKELAVTPGKAFTTPLTINSTDQQSVHTVNIKIVDLGQKEDGSWRIIDTDSNSLDSAEGVDISKLSSCREWMKISATTVQLKQSQQVILNVIINVPPRKNGYYFAGILVSSSMGTQPGGNVGIILRFLVPFIIEVTGRTLKSQIILKDTALEYVNAGENSSSSTMICASVENIGQTFSTVTPFARIWRYQDGHWRIIKTLQCDESKIIPGAKLNLKTDMMRSLPSGKYKVACGLFIDTKRSNENIEKELDFVGDPTITRAAGEAPLDLDSLDIIEDCSPGGSRTSSLKIHNASDEKITIKGQFGVSDIIKGQVIPEAGIKGDEMTCVNWVKMEPQEFTLDSYGEKTVKIVTKVPDLAMQYPYYYAQLNLIASYPDGLPAGVTNANIAVGRNKAKIKPLIQANTIKIQEQDAEKSQFLVLAEFTNKGSLFVDPKRCRVAIARSADGIPMAIKSLSSLKTGIILPFEKRLYTGILDLSSLPAGSYRIEVSLEYGTGQAEKKQIAVQITISKEKRIVNVIGTKDELNELVEVKW
jgi:hypothetical protein